METIGFARHTCTIAVRTSTDLTLRGDDAPAEVTFQRYKLLLPFSNRGRRKGKCNARQFPNVNMSNGPYLALCERTHLRCNSKGLRVRTCFDRSRGWAISKLVGQEPQRICLALTTPVDFSADLVILLLSFRGKW